MKISEQYVSFTGMLPGYYQKNIFPAFHGDFLSPMEEHLELNGSEFYRNRGHTPLLWSYYAYPGRAGSDKGIASNVTWRRIDPFHFFGDFQ